MPHFLADILTSTQWIGTIATGFAYAAAVLGVFLTSRVLHFPDLTIDGSFPLGAGVAAVLTLHGWSHWATLPVAALAGGLAGALTAVLAARLNINGLLASILVALALNSINLRLLGLGLKAEEGRGPTANLALVDTPTIVQGASILLAPLNGTCLASGACLNEGVVARYAQSLVFGAITLMLGTLLYWFLNTEVGLALRAVGDNPQMVRAQGVNSDTMQLLGLAVSNALIAVSGALVIATLGFADVTLGRGLIIVGLAAVIIGEVLVSPRTLRTALAGAIVGSVVYRLFVALALRNTRFIGLQETDLQMVTAVIVFVALSLPRLRDRLLPGRAT